MGLTGTPDITAQGTQNICITCITCMSAQRLRRCPNIVYMLYKCFVFAGGEATKHPRHCIVGDIQYGRHFSRSSNIGLLISFSTELKLIHDFGLSTSEFSVTLDV